MVSTVNDSGKPIELCLVTNLLDVPAETIAQGYRYRWTIELFFRWFKQILGMRHLISTKEKGIKMQLAVCGSDRKPLDRALDRGESQ
jgi:IS4 transposase